MGPLVLMPLLCIRVCGEYHLHDGGCKAAATAIYGVTVRMTLPAHNMLNASAAGCLALGSSCALALAMHSFLW